MFTITKLRGINHFVCKRGGNVAEKPMNKGIDDDLRVKHKPNRIVWFGLHWMTFILLLNGINGDFFYINVTFKQYRGWIGAFRGAIQPFSCGLWRLLLGTTNKVRLLDNGSTGYFNATINEAGMKQRVLFDTYLSVI